MSMKKFALILAASLSLNIVSFAQVKLFDTEITREERTLNPHCSQTPKFS